MSDRKLRTWRVSFVCQIVPAEEAEASRIIPIDQTVTIEVEVDAYTLNAAYDRVQRALQSMVSSNRW